MIEAARPSLPPLKSLRAFEAAARHCSFVKAADELGVTPSAVAQQVRLLENWLGHPLFFRHAHGISATRPTALVEKELTKAFDALSKAVQELRSTTVPNQVRIATQPSIAQLWLSERLPAIKEQFPDLEISIFAHDKPPNLNRDLFDIAIFYAAEVPLDAVGRVILTDVLFPVCAPSLPIDYDDFSGVTLIHDGTWRSDWEKWLKVACAEHVSSQRGPVFSLYSLALKSAMNGDGMLMGRRALVEQSLETGRLRRPFKLEVPGDKLILLLPDRADIPQGHLDLADFLSERHDTS